MTSCDSPVTVLYTSSGTTLVFGSSVLLYPPEITTVWKSPRHAQEWKALACLIGVSSVTDSSVPFMVTTTFKMLLEDTVFALGGRGADGALLTSVERFDVISRTWIHHTNGLLSNTTAGLAVAALPISAVDCVGDCLCGIQGARVSTRIVNSTEAKVKV